MVSLKELDVEVDVGVGAGLVAWLEVLPGLGLEELVSDAEELVELDVLVGKTGVAEELS